jgi:hypothetical protein
LKVNRSGIGWSDLTAGLASSKACASTVKIAKQRGPIAKHAIAVVRRRIASLRQADAPLVLGPSVLLCYSAISAYRKDIRHAE